MPKRRSYTSLIQKQTAWKSFFTLSAIEGLFALLFIFYHPSESKKALLWGYSAERLGLGAVTFILIAIFAFFALNAHKRTKLYIRIIAWVNEYLSAYENICAVVAWGFSAFTMFLTLEFLLISPLAVHLNNLRGYLTRVSPILLWGIAVLSQAGILLWGQYISQKPVRLQDVFKALIPSSLVFLGLAHWIILAFRIQIFTIIDGWFWGFHLKETPNLWLFFPILVFSLVVILAVVKSPERTKRNILLIMVLGYFLQLSFGFIEAGGLRAVQEKYTLSGHKSYALYAADRPSLEVILSHYEENYGTDMFAGTKPPGVILFYVLVQRASAIIFPQDNYDLRLKGLITFITCFYPLLASLAVPALYRFSRLFLNSREAIVPPLLYIFFPNFLLMPLFLDQALYPLLLIISLDLVFRFLIQRSYALALLAGAFIYIAVYFTFSLLPLALLIGSVIGIYYLRQKDKRNYIGLILSFLVGIFLTFQIFHIAFNYDPFLRYSHAIARHREIKSYEGGVTQILDSVLVNNVDYASSIGFPLVILAIAHSVRTLLAFWKKKLSFLDILTLAFIITYLSLLIAGQTRGEVGRLWIFFNPLIALFATIEVLKFSKQSIYNIPVVATLELVTTIFIFKFQNFLV